MKPFLKITGIIFGQIGFGLVSLWYLNYNSDSFNTDIHTNYRDLSDKENEIFVWKDDTSFHGDELYKVYRQHMGDTILTFPRQQVNKVKLFRNKPLIGILATKTLKRAKNKEFIKFCNDSANFDWGETTWGIFESEYCAKLYDFDDKIVGKIYFCLSDCGMTKSIPFCPSMKFGGLSRQGFVWINGLIDNDGNWE